MDMHDNQMNSLATMKVRAVAYFRDLYSCLERPRLILDLNVTFEDAIALEMFVGLSCFPTLNEIRLTLLCVSRGKASGPDCVQRPPPPPPLTIIYPYHV